MENYKVSLYNSKVGGLGANVFDANGVSVRNEHIAFRADGSFISWLTIDEHTSDFSNNARKQFIALTEDVIQNWLNTRSVETFIE